jgi:hypothetical protein
MPDNPDLRQIGFAIEEKLGKFGTTPSSLRAAFKKPLQDQYICTQCKQPIAENAYMYSDMSKPAEGWRHYICPVKI